MKRDGCDALMMIFTIGGASRSETQRGSDTARTANFELALTEGDTRQLSPQYWLGGRVT